MMFLLLVMMLTLVGSSRACPAGCRCSLDERGRRGVLCEAGGMDFLPVLDISPDTEVLVISAPSFRPNSLTLGPIFKRHRRLEEIHITHSGIPAIGAHSLWGLNRLRVLNLTNNFITALMDTNFKGAEVLHHLDLSHNRIQSVPSAVFHHVHHLRTLTLAHNVIPELVSRIFFGLARLERLDLSHNPLGDLHAEKFLDVPELKQLFCAGCHISSISKTLLQTLPQLHELDLRDNRLTQVPLGIAALPNLVTLKLDGNHLSFVERGSISGSPVTSLHIAHNRISRLEADAFANSSIKHLDLSYNRLTHLEHRAIKYTLNQLHDLQLSGNSLQVDQLLAVLPKARQLRRLGLGDMGLTTLHPELFQHSHHLHHLNLSANYLTSFSTVIFRNAHNLRSLDLSLNSFRGLDKNFFDSVNAAVKLRILRLEGNPWHCDQCHAGPLLRWLQDAPDQESGCREPRVWTCLKCLGPQGVAGVQLALLPPGDLPACPFTTPAAEAVMPTWVEPSLSVMTDEPELPRGQLTRQEDIGNVDWSVKDVMREKMYLVIVAGSIMFMLLVAVIVVAIVLYHRHTAFYYTNENDPEKKERLMRFKFNKNNNSSPGIKKPTIDLADATIATIDEMTNIAGSQEVLEEDDKPEDDRNHVTTYVPVTANHHNPAVVEENHVRCVSPAADHLQESNHMPAAIPGEDPNHVTAANYTQPQQQQQTPTDQQTGTPIL